MDQQFLEDFYPLTSKIGFFKANLQEVADSFEEWNREVLQKVGVKYGRSQIRGKLNELLLTLQPLTSPVNTKELFISAKGSWVAYFDNGWKGANAPTVVNVLTKRIGCRGVSITAVPNTMPSKIDKSTRGKFGAAILEVFDKGERSRTIYSANDGGRWVFGQSGIPFDFEDTASYKRKMKKDRFNILQMEEYLCQLGIEAFVSEYYDSLDLAVQFQRESGTLSGYREYSLSEIRQLYS